MEFLRSLLQETLSLDADVSKVTRSDIFPNGVSFQGKININYSVLVKHFGEPDVHGKDEDIVLDWVIVLHAENTDETAPILIYPDTLKHGENPSDEQSWRIAAKDSSDYYVFREKVLPHLN